MAESANLWLDEFAMLMAIRDEFRQFYGAWCMHAWAAGVSPGEPEYINLKALKLIDGADYVAGFKQAPVVKKK